MKKAYLSPGTSLLVSLSLALGILVSDLGGYGILTRAYARADTCGSQSNYTTVVSNFVKISDGLILGGIAVRGVVFDGRVLEQALIAGSVHISDGTVVGANGVLVSDGSPSPEGVLVSDGGPTSETNGVLVSDGGPCLYGVLVSDGAPTAGANGVLVSDGITVNGVLVSDGVTATGGILTGDNVTFTGGVITGQNLRLAGATLAGQTVDISGTITSVQISPAN